MYGYIYKTTNKITSKIYIGQKKSKNFLGNQYLGSGKKLREAVQKYGKEAFIVEELDQATSREELNSKEKEWIQKLNATDKTIGYNLSDGGNVPCMTGIHNPFYGKKHSEETKKHLSEIRKGRKRPGNPSKFKLSEESKRKIGEKNRGRIKTPEEIEKHRKTYKENRLKVGCPWVTEEYRKKLSDIQKKRLSDKSILEERSKRTLEKWKDPEYRQKHVEGMKGPRGPRGPGKTANLGMKMYNNGKINVFAKECPEGFVLGKLKK